MNLTVDRLETLVDLENVPSELRATITTVLSAINDWPQVTTSVDEYEKEVSAFLGGNVTKERIEGKDSSMDFSRHAWEAESLTEILEVFAGPDELKELKEIFEELQEKIRGL